MPLTAHRGVAEDDPRNRGAVDHFRPPEVTDDYVRERLGAAFRRESPAELEARVARFMTDLAAKPHRPPPPLSEPVEAATDPWFGLGVHPDIIEQLWKLDGALPGRCRWLVWGHPALVRPDNGVIFAVAIGTLGIAARLPPEGRGGLPTTHPLGFGRDYDLAPAGPAWRFLPSPPGEALARAAFAYAGD